MPSKADTTRMLTDHDVLVTLKANFDTFLVQYTKDVIDLKDGTTQKIEDHERRVSSVEKLIDEVNPMEVLKQHKANTDWIAQFKVTWKVVLIAVSLASSFLGIIATIIGITSGLFRLK